ncbi:wiskott-Aldrich syndrome protein family member 1-like protein [Willisornis vidua]|uniref:Wiskott-Aldrich syndrome protein family member 1-like protein n=1 Tax=Willisornis vidua TaxID=1566151 RepID=A0ABQ9D3I4_9PASS|nr:wiskott-Aldrich syndrome protein family member 1-like protein [Willisornis vidua]
MPFPLRTLEPLKLCRLEEAGGDGAERGGPAPGDPAGVSEGGGGRRRGTVPLFGTLEQVSSYALVSLLMQLSDLSRCAGDIFGGILSEADSLCHRNARLQRRLGALEELLARLDHRKVKIRVSCTTQLGGICKLAEGALNPFIYAIDETELVPVQTPEEHHLLRVSIWTLSY